MQKTIPAVESNALNRIRRARSNELQMLLILERVR